MEQQQSFGAMLWAWGGMIYIFGVLTTLVISFTMFERRRIRIIDIIMSIIIAAFSWFGFFALIKGEDKLYNKKNPWK